MVQRGIFRKDPSPAIRITRPGVDIADAGPLDFLLHEDHLYTQPYFFGFVACPFAGNTSNSGLSSSVDVTVPGFDANPIVLMYPLTSTSVTCFPAPRAKGHGSNQHGFPLDLYEITWQVLSSTIVRVNFSKPSTSTRSPAGCYLVLMRRPT